MTVVARTTRKGPDGRDVLFVQGIDRGMVFWATVTAHHAVGSEQFHDQPSPWLVVSSSRLHQRLPIVIAVPLSTQLQKEEAFRGARIRILASHMTPIPPVPPNRALQGDSLALTEQIRVLAHKRLLDEPVARVSRTALLNVEAGMKYVLEIG